MTQASFLRQADVAAKFRTAPSDVTSAIRTASSKTGVDFAFLMEKASAESGFKSDAKASGSSATGLFQFIDSTWLNMMKNYGEKYGFGEEAKSISRRIDGSPVISDPDHRQRILDLRNDPRASALLAAEYAKENKEFLQQSVGGNIGSTDVYMAHFLGPQGAARFLNEMHLNPNGSAADLFPDAAKANRGVFFRDGRALTLSQVYDRFSQRFQGDLVTAGIQPDDPERLITRQVQKSAITAGASNNNVAPSAIPLFTVMMLAQLSRPAEGTQSSVSPALGGRKDGQNHKDPASLVLTPPVAS